MSASDALRRVMAVQPRMVAAGPDHMVGPAFSDVVKRAVVLYYGSVKAAAISLRVDASLMQREFDAGKFRRLDAAGSELNAFIADALHEACSPAAPRAVRRQRIVELLDLLLSEVA